MAFCIERYVPSSLSTPLGALDSGEVSYTVLGYSGLLAVTIAGWTTANPTFYRATLSFVDLGIMIILGLVCSAGALESMKKIIIGCDEADDYGAEKGEVILYPDVAYKVAEQIAAGNYERGILLCGTGIGMSICANKVPGVRAAVCHDPFSTERSRKSNNAQIMCMGERVVGVELAKYLVDIWLNCDFSGGGSTPKVERIMVLEQKYRKA